MAWVILPVFLKSFLYRGVDLFHAPIESFASKWGETQDYWALRLRSKNQLIEDYRALSRQQSHDRMQFNQLNSISSYVDRLERLLSMSPKRDYRAEYARVIRRDVNTWLESIKIDKGRKDGIELNQAVVFVDGLVGRVSEVKQTVATVTLISSPAFRITVNSPNDDRSIAFSGRGQNMWQSPKAAAHHIPQDIDVNETHPLELYTSGLGGAMPAGIFVGELVLVEPELEGLFQKGEIRLSKALRSLREVAVLIPLELGD